MGICSSNTEINSLVEKFHCYPDKQFITYLENTLVKYSKNKIIDYSKLNDSVNLVGIILKLNLLIKFSSMTQYFTTQYLMKEKS